MLRRFVPPPLTSNQVDQKDPPAPTRGNAAVPTATRSPATVVTVSEYAHVKTHRPAIKGPFIKDVRTKGVGTKADI